VRHRTVVVADPFGARAEYLAVAETATDQGTIALKIRPDKTYRLDVRAVLPGVVANERSTDWDGVANCVAKTEVMGCDGGIQESFDVAGRRATGEERGGEGSAIACGKGAVQGIAIACVRQDSVR
jgi:hypothetical protein